MHFQNGSLIREAVEKKKSVYPSNRYTNKENAVYTQDGLLLSFEKQLQYSCLENATDRGAWWASIHGEAKSRMQLSD